MKTMSALSQKLQEVCTNQTPIIPPGYVLVKSVSVSENGSIRFSTVHRETGEKATHLLAPNGFGSDGKPLYTVVQLEGAGTKAETTMTEADIYQLLFGAHLVYE